MKSLGVFIFCLVFATLYVQSTEAKNAYVCIHYEGTPKDTEYVLGTRVLLKSLKMSGTKHDMIVLVAPNVRQETRATFRNDGAKVIEVKNIHNPWKVHQVKDNEGGGTYQSRFEYTLNKLHLWNLTEYERVIYLDADNIVLSKLDELFHCGHFCAVYMNPCNFHTGLLVVKPDVKMFQKLMDGLKEARSYDGADQGFFTYFFNYERMGGAKMFDPFSNKDSPSEEELMRLPPGYNLNALWFYEKGDWHLYRCHSRFVNLTVPGVSLTFPTPPWLKPWYWWPYLLLDSNWFLWQSFRAELEESFTSVIFTTVTILFALVLFTFWGVPFVTNSPLLITSFERYFNRPLAYVSSLLGSNVTGIVLGLICTFLTCFLPWMLLPGVMPPSVGWFTFSLSELVANFVLLSFLSVLIVERYRRLSVDGLMKQTAKSMIPSIVVMGIIFVISKYQLYPKGLPFHTGKILSVFSTGIIFLLMQIAAYRKLVVDRPPLLPGGTHDEY